jgi:hypothetical protein
MKCTRQLCHKRPDEALGLGVAIGIANPTHAGRNPVSVKQAGIFGTGVLHATVEMVDQAGSERAPRRQRHGRRPHRQTDAEMVGMAQPMTAPQVGRILWRASPPMVHDFGRRHSRSVQQK